MRQLLTFRCVDTFCVLGSEFEQRIRPPRSCPVSRMTPGIIARGYPSADLPGRPMSVFGPVQADPCHPLQVTRPSQQFQNLS